MLKFAAAIFTLPLCGFSVGIEPVEGLVYTAAVGGELTGVLDSSIIPSDLERWKSFTRCETRLRNKFISPTSCSCCRIPLLTPCAIIGGETKSGGQVYIQG